MRCLILPRLLLDGHVDLAVALRLWAQEMAVTLGWVLTILLHLEGWDSGQLPGVFYPVAVDDWGLVGSRAQSLMRVGCADA